MDVAQQRRVLYLHEWEGRTFSQLSNKRCSSALFCIPASLTRREDGGQQDTRRHSNEWRPSLVSRCFGGLAGLANLGAEKRGVGVWFLLRDGRHACPERMN